MSAIPDRLIATIAAVLELRGERKFVYKHLSNTTLSMDEILGCVLKFLETLLHLKIRYTHKEGLLGGTASTRTF